MGDTGTAKGGSSFRGALRNEGLRLERTVVGAGVLLSALGGVVVLTHYLVTGLHVEALALCGAILLWTMTAWLLLRAGIGTRVLPWVDPVVESLFPTVLLLAEARGMGGRAAGLFTSAPVVYMFSVMLSVVRLRTLTPLMSATIGAVGYFLALDLSVIPRLVAELPITRDEFVNLHVRGAFIFVGGIMGTFVVWALRKASGQAHSEVRAHELFGKYRLGPEIASGGMGVVLKATYCPEGGFEREVAMKRIHPHLVKEAKLVDAFRSEAELSARMLHPNIVQVLDFGRVDEAWFCAMEYVEGFTLSSALRACNAAQRPLPPELLAYIGREVCAGLEYAHRGALGGDGQPLDVIHRDLTPSNVLLAKTGQVKIADFGVARALKGAAQAHTQTMAGKLPYMAPEQTSGGGLDGRTDLFTLGVVLWEALCGRMLFYRDNEAATRPHAR